jgi:tetratricopeptide (TPR) repeat protein
MLNAARRRRWSTQRVLEVDPQHYEVLRTLRRHGEAIEYHRRAAREREGDVQPLYSLAADYMDSGANENAKAVLNRIIEIAPKRSLNAYRQFRALCMSEGAWDRAWEIQQRIEEQLSEMGRSSETGDSDKNVFIFSSFSGSIPVAAAIS